MARRSVTTVRRSDTAHSPCFPRRGEAAGLGFDMHSLRAAACMAPCQSVPRANRPRTRGPHRETVLLHRCGAQAEERCGHSSSYTSAGVGVDWTRNNEIHSALRILHGSTLSGRKPCSCWLRPGKTTLGWASGCKFAGFASLMNMSIMQLTALGAVMQQHAITYVSHMRQQCFHGTWLVRQSHTLIDPSAR